MELNFCIDPDGTVNAKDVVLSGGVAISSLAEASANAATFELSGDTVLAGTVLSGYTVVNGLLVQI